MIVYPAKDEVWCCGDLHGNLNWIPRWLEHHDLTDCTIIFCGDIGLGFEPWDVWCKWMKNYRLKDVLENRNIQCFCIRGNHDDPSLFDGRELTTSRMLAIPDYSVVSTNSHNILCVGGGLSVDRHMRIHDMALKQAQFLQYHPGATTKDALARLGESYWPDELPVYDQAALDDLESTDLKIDVMCTHAAPSSFPPFTQIPDVWIKKDSELMKDAAKERGVLEDLKAYMLQHHPVSKWFYGHYHEYGDVWIDNVNAVCLDMARDGFLSMRTIDIYAGRDPESTQDDGGGAEASD